MYGELWLELQTAVNPLLWGLGTELSSSVRAILSLNSKPLSNQGNNSPTQHLGRLALVLLLISLVPQYFL